MWQTYKLWCKIFSEISIITQERIECFPELGSLYLFMGLKLKIKNKEHIFYLIVRTKIIIVQWWKIFNNLRIELWINKASISSTAILEKVRHKIRMMKHQRQEPQFYQIWTDSMHYLNWKTKFNVMLFYVMYLEMDPFQWEKLGQFYFLHILDR